MRSRLILGLSAAVALSLSTACSDGAKVVKGLEKLRDKACACEDQGCADKVLDEAVEFLLANKDQQGTEEQGEQATRANAEMFNCLMKAGASQEKILKANEKLKEALQ